MPERQTTVTRIDLLLYGGQTMRIDFAALHWSERAARSVGLPDVIMHGPLLLEKSLEVLYDWTGDPGSVSGYNMRCFKPVPVPDDERGAVFQFSGEVEEMLTDRRVTAVVAVQCPGLGTVAKVTATVRLG